MFFNEKIWMNIIKYVPVDYLHLLIKCSKTYMNIIKNYMYNNILSYFEIDKKNISEMDKDNFSNIFDFSHIDNIDNIINPYYKFYEYKIYEDLYKIYASIYTNWFIADKLFIFVEYYEDERNSWINFNIILYNEQENIFILCDIEEDASLSPLEKNGLKIRIVTPNGEYEGSNEIFQMLYEDEVIKHEKLLEDLDSYKSYEYISDSESDSESDNDSDSDSDGKEYFKSKLLAKDDNIPISIISDYELNFYTCGSPKLNNAINDLLCNKSIDIYDDGKYSSCSDWSLSNLIKTFQRHRYASNI